MTARQSRPAGLEAERTDIDLDRFGQLMSVGS
jgi:hypothetical protein